MNNYILISIILCYCLLIASFVYGASNKRIRQNNKGRLYLLYLGFIISIETTSLFSIYILEFKNTQFIYPFYISGEFLILINLFLEVLKPSKSWNVIKWILTCLIFFESTLLWFIQNDATTGYGKIVSHLMIISFAAILLLKNMKELEKNDPLSTIYASLFLYYGVSLFLFLIINQLTEMNISIWTINNILSSILYGSFLLTFYNLKRC